MKQNTQPAQDVSENLFTGTHSDEYFELLRDRSLLSQTIDFIGAPLRMLVLPDRWSKKFGLTSLEDERFRAVLPEIRGRLLDIGAGANRLVQLYGSGVGVDVIDWGGGVVVVDDTRDLPFPDGSFDTVTLVACLNHIPYREEVLQEAYRVLVPGGKLVVTMIGRVLGDIGHALWWYSEDKHREIQAGELMGMSNSSIKTLLKGAGFKQIMHRRFLYWMNNLFVAQKEIS